MNGQLMTGELIFDRDEMTEGEKQLFMAEFA